LTLPSAQTPLRCGAVVGLRWFGLQVVEDRIDLALQARHPLDDLALAASSEEREGALELGDAGLELPVVAAAVRVAHSVLSSLRSLSSASARRSSARRMFSSTDGVQPGKARASSGCASTHAMAAGRIVWTPWRSKMPGRAWSSRWCASDQSGWSRDARCSGSLT